jgi:hypothetical protein
MSTPPLAPGRHLAPHASVATDGVLSKEQKAFNRLIKKINAQRATLQAWHTMRPQYIAKQAGVFEPLLARFNAQREQLVYLLDRHHDDAKGLTKNERAKLRQIIGTMTSDLAGPDNTPEFIALYEKYTGSSYAEDESVAMDDLKSMIEDITGVAVDDAAEIHSPEELMAHLQQKLQAQQEAVEQKKSKRKPTAAAQARQAKQEAEAQSMSLSVREIYRKLASALHPDREPDEAERIRKTALMQRVNAAYGKSDLLQLLELQLEIEQITHADISTLADARLKHYNKVLAEQLRELEMENSHAEMSFSGPFSMRGRAHPALVLKWLDADIAELQTEFDDMAHDMQNLVDTKALKAWLKNLPLHRNDGFEDFMFDEHDFF